MNGRQDGHAGGPEARVREPRARHRPHRLAALAVGQAAQLNAHLVRAAYVEVYAICAFDRDGLFRCRCVFELWIAATMRGCTLDLIMPPSEGERFVKTLVTDFNSIAMALSKVWPVVVP